MGIRNSKQQNLPNGVWPTMITPFQEDGSVDYTSLRRLVDWYINQGAAGLFAVCQSSEMFFLSKEEKIGIAEATVQYASGRVPVICSGHTSDTLEDQIEEMTALAQTGVDAVVLITNRLAGEDEPDRIFIERLEKLIDTLPQGIKLGFYECPYPYKRLISDEVLEYVVHTGRFSFLKDTCCDSERIRNRLAVMKGSDFKLYNANSATLSESIRYGVNGYSGIMANFHPSLYARLVSKQLQYPGSGDDLQNLLGPLSSVEDAWYPLSAKHHLKVQGIIDTVRTRKPGPECLDENHIRIIEQMHQLISTHYGG